MLSRKHKIIEASNRFLRDMTIYTENKSGIIDDQLADMMAKFDSAIDYTMTKLKCVVKSGRGGKPDVNACHFDGKTAEWVSTSEILCIFNFEDRKRDTPSEHMYVKMKDGAELMNIGNTSHYFSLNDHWYTMAYADDGVRIKDNLARDASEWLRFYMRIKTEETNFDA